MSCRRIHLPSFAAALLLSACASTGGGDSSPSGGESVESGGGGIQTRAIRSAPATQQTRNESRPLSELNTPEAVAAREEAKRNGLATATGAPVARGSSPARPAANGPAATTARPAAAPTAVAARAPPAALAKGMKVRLRGGTALGARPSIGSDSTPAVASEFELGPQIYNAGGYWWYVSNGKEAGWVLQTDLQP